MTGTVQGIDDAGQLFAGGAFKFAVTDRVGKFFHFCQHGVDLGHHVFAVDIYRRVLTIAQSRMQNRPVFGNIDFFAGKHRFDFVAQLYFVRQFQQVLQGLFVKTVFGIVQIKRSELNGIFGSAFGIKRKQVFHFNVLKKAVMKSQFLPCFCFGNVFFHFYFSQSDLKFPSPMILRLFGVK